MITYIVKCVANPCGAVSGKYLGQYENVWTTGVPKLGIDINEAYRQRRNIAHDNWTCACVFEVMEIK